MTRRQRHFLVSGFGILSLLVGAVSVSPAATPSGPAAGPSIASVTIQPETVPASSTGGVVTSCTWHSTAHPTCITSPGASATGTVTLSAAAPPGGAVISLSVSGSKSCGVAAITNNPQSCVAKGAWIPWAVFIPAGHVQAVFPVYAEKFQSFRYNTEVTCLVDDPVLKNPLTGKPLSTLGTCLQSAEGSVWAIVQAAYGGAAKSAFLTVQPGLNQPPPTCSGGSSLQFVGGMESGQYAPIPGGRVGQAYSVQLFQGGRDPSVILSGGPGGLQLGKNGVLSGVPAVPGEFRLNIQVAESCGASPRFATAALHITETIPPQISSVTLTPNPLPANGGEVVLSLRAADNVGIARVLLTQVKPTGEQNSGIVPLVAGTPTNGEWRTTWRIAGNSTTAAQTYTIKVKVEDAAGNAVEAQPIQLAVAGGSGQQPQIPQGSPALPGQQTSQRSQVPQGAQQTPQGTASQGSPPPQPPQGMHRQQAPPAPAQVPQALQVPQGSQGQPIREATQPLQRVGPSPAAPVVGPGPAPAAPGGPVQFPDWWVRPITPQDAALAQAIQTRLQQSSNGPWGRVAGKVGVEVSSGVVRLTGKLPNVQHRAAIENTVRATQGVCSVTNAIAVGP